MATRLSGRDLEESLLSLCVLVGSSYSTSVKTDVTNVGPFRALKRSPPDPKLYSEASSFARDWQVYNLLRKFPLLRGSSRRGRLESAASSFVAAEQKCRMTNDWIRGFRTGSVFPILRDGSVSGAALILEVQSQIRKILGPFDRKRLLAECRWSNGATATTRRGLTVAQKHSSAFAVTPRAQKWAEYVIRRDPTWCEVILGTRPEGYFSFYGVFDNVRGSKVTAVPKTAYTDRTIAAEPALNSFLQQGFGRWLRRRLGKWGCHLDDQSYNQEGAKQAFSQLYSTLDLESASDTVSFELVKLLLPERYVDYLEDLRSPYTLIGDKWLKLEKFSSMGNAFTFELESLIFLAVVRACENLTGSRPVSLVYGDDIICSREAAECVVSALEFFGFTINKTKSFVDGPFFESCGEHYFQGEPVTPCYIDAENLSVVNQIRTYNKVLRWGRRVFGDYLCPEVRAILSGRHFEKRHVFMQPPGGELDIGYITLDFPFVYDRNCGYRLKGIESRVLLRDSKYDLAQYAYKLRHPHTLNLGPKGQNQDGVGERWVTTERWWPEANFA